VAAVDSEDGSPDEPVSARSVDASEPSLVDAFDPVDPLPDASSSVAFPPPGTSEKQAVSPSVTSHESDRIDARLAEALRDLTLV
jgi:hypothetical protein